MPGGDLLFVYGTLMSSASGRLGRAERARLYREGHSLGPASTPGRLYDLGCYPGMTDPLVADERVHGEAVKLANPAATFLWLDAYEEIRPGAAGSEYRRAERPVRLASGIETVAAVYLYAGDLGKARHLPEGRWIGG
jgi:gamma-glutamylcyclotransferase (GGCT)/AIG2-like uncharacterized protein YtfP